MRMPLRQAGQHPKKIHAMTEIDLAIERDRLEKLLAAGHISPKEGRDLAKIRRAIDGIETLKEDM